MLFDPTPDLPDDMEIERIRWPTRIQTVLNNAGIRTVGELRDTSDADILRFRRGGPDLQGEEMKAFLKKLRRLRRFIFKRRELKATRT